MRLPATIRLACLACILCGCTGLSELADTSQRVTESELLSGSPWFDRPIVPSDLPEYDLLRLDDEMQAFVAAAVPRSGSNAMRLESLLRAMGESGLTAVDYDAQMTRTASELFHARDGNCLAYTNLFVALAREAGLRVSYQQVDVPPTWSMDGDLLLISQHVNARVHDVVRQRSRREDRVIDFNAPQFSGHFRQRTVSDNVVEALFYNNLGVAKLQQGDQRAAFLHFRKALDADADAAAAWTNLGVLYTRVGASDLAESAFHRALRGEPGNEPAMSNLARLYRTRGEDALADAYEERLERHRQRNPYYHYLLAERALRDGRVDRALDAVDKAIRMREEEHQFHFLRARILAKNGRMQAAVSSLERARDHAGIAAARDQYARKLGDLE